MPTGRPSSYSNEIAERICEMIAEGNSLVSICGEDDMPTYRTVARWLESNEEFRQNYARAREDSADYYAERITLLADQEPPVVEGRVDPGEVANRRLQIDSLKWIASKLKPKKYGDQSDKSTTVNVGVGVQVGLTEEQRQQIMERRRAALGEQEAAPTARKLEAGEGQS